MRIAFDVHGTLDNDPCFVARQILLAMLRTGHDIFIISGPPIHQIEKEIKVLNIIPQSVKIISVVDWLTNKGVQMTQDKNGNWWCINEEDWWKSKGQICKKYEISVIFDDKIEYSFNMPKTTKFIQW